jgi:hypothetical protein
LSDVGAALGRIGDRGLGNVGYVRDRSVQRLEAPGGLAVVVGRHQELDGIDTAAGAPRVLESALGSFIPRVLWPDTLSLASDGFLYFTANQLHRQARFHAGKDLRRKPYALFRVKVDARPVLLRQER